MKVPDYIRNDKQLFRTEAKIAASRQFESARLFWAKKWREIVTEAELKKAPKYLEVK